jgi:hypothetical protein
VSANGTAINLEGPKYTNKTGINPILFGSTLAWGGIDKG